MYKFTRIFKFSEGLLKEYVELNKNYTGDIKRLNEIEHLLRSSAGISFISLMRSLENNNVKCNGEFTLSYIED